MPTDPSEIARAQERLRQIMMLAHQAGARASRPPRIDPSAWRGPAYSAYLLAAEELAGDLRSLAGELRHASELARAEVLDALA